MNKTKTTPPIYTILIYTRKENVITQFLSGTSLNSHRAPKLFGNCALGWRAQELLTGRYNEFYFWEAVLSWITYLCRLGLLEQSPSQDNLRLSRNLVHHHCSQQLSTGSSYSEPVQFTQHLHNLIVLQPIIHLILPDSIAAKYIRRRALCYFPYHSTALARTPCFTINDARLPISVNYF